MNLKNMKRFSPYLKAHRWSILAILVFAVLGTIFTVTAPRLIGDITTELFNGVTNNYQFNWTVIQNLFLLLLAAYLIGQLFSFFQGYLLTKVSARVMEKLREDVSRKMHKLPLNYFDSRTNGEILSVVTNDIDTLNNAINQNLIYVITELTTAIGILFMMFSINAWLALLAITIVPLSLLAANGAMTIGQKNYEKQQGLIGQFNGFVEEHYNGQMVIQTFNYQEETKRQFKHLNDELGETAKRALIGAGNVQPIIRGVNNLGIVLSTALGAIFTLQGHMTVGNIQSMLQYTQQFGAPFNTLASMTGIISAAAAASERIVAVLDAEEESEEQSVTVAPTNFGPTKGGRVEFKHVQFNYHPETPLMEDVNFTVQPGQKVAIVGPTGAGKTTLINLLMRFYDIQGGQILIDGQDTAKMTRAELRSRFAMVLQDTWLFDGTISDNLRYSRQALTAEDAIQAAKSAYAHNFIQTLPDTYDFHLEKSGTNISQGERQLLTIARAIAANPDIMILDEATSNVDTHTELKIQQAMKELMAGRTSFVIAHRLSTIIDADMIIYMEKGDIKEIGTHDQLLKKQGKYADLYKSQFA